MKQIVIVIAALGLLASVIDVNRSDDVKPDIIATFSIAAVDPSTGECGAAVASRYPAVGKVVAHARPGVGAFCTQHNGVQAWGVKALDAMAAKKLPEEVLTELLKDDKNAGGRQLGIIDMQGRSAQRMPVTAPKQSYYWGGMSGKFYVCQGNTLNGRDVITAMSKAYEETKGTLADRLMAALVAGDCAGGDHRGRLAAGIRVCKKDIEGYWLDLHVDKSDDAVVELHRKYAATDHPAIGEWGKQKWVHPCPNRPAPKRPD